MADTDTATAAELSLVAPAAHFKRPVVRAFVDWALEEARQRDGAAPAV